MNRIKNKYNVKNKFEFDIYTYLNIKQRTTKEHITLLKNKFEFDIYTYLNTKKRMPHFTYNSAPSKLNKKELYEEYINLVEHSKKNDFLVSCNSPPTRAKKNQYKAMKDMIRAQKRMIKLYEDKDEISASVIKDYDDKIEYLENKIADMENKNVEYDVEISNLNLELKEYKEYEELFNKVRAERDDIEHDLSEEIHTLRKDNERLEIYKSDYYTIKQDHESYQIEYEKLKEDIKLKDEIIKLHECGSEE